MDLGGAVENERKINAPIMSRGYYETFCKIFRLKQSLVFIGHLPAMIIFSVQGLRQIT